VFVYELLEMATTLGRTSWLHVLRNELKYFADSKISKMVLSFVFGSKNALIVVNK